MKFLLIFEWGALHFQFALGLTNCVASPAFTRLSISWDTYLGIPKLRRKKTSYAEDIMLERLHGDYVGLERVAQGTPILLALSYLNLLSPGGRYVNEQVFRYFRTRLKVTQLTLSGAKTSYPGHGLLRL